MNSFEKITNIVSLNWIKILHNELSTKIIFKKLSSEKKFIFAHSVIHMENNLLSFLTKAVQCSPDDQQKKLLLNVIEIYEDLISKQIILKQLAIQTKQVNTSLNKMLEIISFSSKKKNYWRLCLFISYVLIIPYEQLKNATANYKSDYIDKITDDFGREWIQIFNSKKYRAIYAKLLNNIKDFLPPEKVTSQNTYDLEKILIYYLKFLNDSFIEADYSSFMKK